MKELQEALDRGFFRKEPSVRKRHWLRKKFSLRQHRIFDIFTSEFQMKVEQITGLKWDFQRLHNSSTSQCCVVGCGWDRLYGHWVCSTHLLVELKHFDPVDEYGNLFWSHQNKEQKIASLVKKT